MNREAAAIVVRSQLLLYIKRHMKRENATHFAEFFRRDLKKE